MPKKKSLKLAATHFKGAANTVLDFFAKTSGLKEDYHIWCTDFAVIRLYAEFEVLMLETLAGAINNDTTTISSTLSVPFLKHLNEDVCKFLVVGTGFFDFKGRDGLIKVLRKYVPQTHYLVAIIKEEKFKNSLEKLSALRNFAAHQSEPSRAAAAEAVGGDRIGSAGAWLKRQGRFEAIVKDLIAIAEEIEKKAPY